LHRRLHQLPAVATTQGFEVGMHRDWYVMRVTEPLDDKPGRAFNKLLSGFVYFGDICTRGETYFPGLKDFGPGADGLKFPKRRVERAFIQAEKRQRGILE